MQTSSTTTLIFLTLGYLVLFILIAIFNFYPPKSKNKFYGYRTPLSFKNEKNWKFANRLAPKLILICSLISLLVALFIWFGTEIDISKKVSIIIVCMVAGLIVPIPFVEYLTFRNEREN